MPAETPFERTKERRRHQPKIPIPHITILRVVLDAIRKDVVYPQLGNAKTVPLEKRASFTGSVGERDRATHLRLRMLRDHFFDPPEPAVTVRRQDPEHLPG